MGFILNRVDGHDSSAVKLHEQLSKKAFGHLRSYTKVFIEAINTG